MEDLWLESSGPGNTQGQFQMTDLTGIEDFRALKDLYIQEAPSGSGSAYSTNYPHLIQDLDFSQPMCIERLEIPAMGVVGSVNGGTYTLKNTLTLDLSGLYNLKQLWLVSSIPANGIIDLSNNLELEFVNAWNNSGAQTNGLCSELTGNFDVTQNPKLKALLLCHNSITTLDLSQNPALVYLNVDDNLLTTLDISNMTVGVTNYGNTPPNTSVAARSNNLTDIYLGSALPLNTLNLSANTNPPGLTIHCGTVQRRDDAQNIYLGANFDVPSGTIFVV